METTKTQKIVISIIILVILLSTYILLSKKGNDTENANTSTETATTTSSVNNTISSGNGAYTIERVSIESGSNIPKPIPNLDREAVVYSGAIITEQGSESALPKIKALQTSLKSNPADLPSWIDLGIYQKMAGDYLGAVESWKYAVKLAPSSFVALGNLGNIYAFFIKDNGMAETYYKQAIKVSPTTVYLYAQLFEVYKDIFKDVDKARAIVEEGLKNIPNDPLLLQMRDSLQ